MTHWAIVSVCTMSHDDGFYVQVDAAKPDGSSSRISPYTKSYLEGTDDDVVDPNTTSSCDVSEPRRPSDTVDRGSSQLAGSKTTQSTGRFQSLPSTADSPYVSIPADGSDLPISAYSCIEQQAANDGDASLRQDAGVRPQDSVIERGEGTKCDGYVPWSSTQP